MGTLAYTRRQDEQRVYCEGVSAQKAGDLKNTNPYTTPGPAEFAAAWDQGWDDADAGDSDLSMCGYPVAGKPSPEVLYSPRY